MSYIVIWDRCDIGREQEMSPLLFTRLWAGGWMSTVGNNERVYSGPRTGRGVEEFRFGRLHRTNPGDCGHRVVCAV